MSRLNELQAKIKMLEGGRFQKLCDRYLYRKYRLENIVSLGSMDGTDKTTKGTPDAYFFNENIKKYTLVMHGTSGDSTRKLKTDIKDAISKSKLSKKEIDEIICCHTSSNITVEDDRSLRNLASPIKLNLIGIDTLAHDLSTFEYQDIADEFLNIKRTTNQVWSIEKFIRIHDQSGTNASIANEYIDEKLDIESMIGEINKHQIFVIKGDPGVGKTRLATEICKKLNKDSNVITVKSNELSIYDDVSYALNPDKINYLFLDDANTITSLDAVLALLNLEEYREKLKVIITIRSYAYSHIQKQISHYHFCTFEKNLMKEENIEALIDSLDKEIPHSILTRVKELSKNNPRLAVLAVQMYKKQGTNWIGKDNEILTNYYAQILKENEITTEEINTLFILNVFTKIKLNDEMLRDVLDYFEISVKTFKETVFKLHDKELCNIYENIAVKISDQSLGDYIAVWFVSKRKKMSISDLFERLYPKHDKELIQLINTVNQFEHTETWFNYLKSEVRSVYNNFIDESIRGEFLAKFAMLLPLEGLDYVSNVISSTAEKRIEIRFEDFVSEVKYIQVKDEIILILCRLADTNKMELAAELLLKYINIQQDKIYEGYVAIKDYFNVMLDIPNYLFKRKAIIQSVQNVKGLSQAAYILIIEICKEYLKYSGEYITGNDKGVTFQRYELPDGEYLISHHKEIFDILFEVYNVSDKNIKSYVDEIILNYPVLKFKKGYIETVTADLKYIEKHFIKKINKLSIREENIVSQLKTKAEIYQMKFIPFKTYTETQRQKLYNTLTNREVHNILFNVEYEEYERTRINYLVDVHHEYKNSYLEMFNTINELMQEDVMKGKRSEIEKSLLDLYTHIEREGKVKFLKGLLQSNYVFKVYHIKYFTSLIDYSEGAELVKFAKPHLRVKWELALLMTSNKREKYSIEKMDKFLRESNDAYLLNEYSVVDFEMIFNKSPNLIKEILRLYDEGVLKTSFFIPKFINEKDAKKLMQLVSKDIIRKIYLDSIAVASVDELALVFSMILDEKFAREFMEEVHVQKMNNTLSRSIDYSRHIKYLWNTKDIERVIKKYIRYLYNKKEVFWVGIDSVLEKVLSANKKSSIELIKSEIIISSDEDYIVTLLNIATELFDGKILLDIYLLVKNKNITLKSFKKLHFIKMSKSWTGSYVPVIDQELEFIKGIISIFEDQLEFIPHVRHLSDINQRLYQKKQEELLRDYLEES